MGHLDAFPFPLPRQMRFFSLRQGVVVLAEQYFGSSEVLYASATETDYAVIPTQCTNFLIMNHKPYARVLRDPESLIIAWRREVFQNLLASAYYW